MKAFQFTLITILGLCLGSSLAFADGPSPEEAVKRMKLATGFKVTAVAHEPMTRQPLSISFDDRGRMWVLQYLQYPNPAGMKAIKQDQYLRTVWDIVPEPPPHGPKGIDRITILSEPDANGVYTKSKDFLSDLNMAGGFCLGHGGVYVVQPPYLLFYADKNGDDIPDGDPEVLLSGFGLDDTHSLANSLQWGPDGWLYGATGSTSTARIKNPREPKAPVVEFQQGIWRFHPLTKKFELFSEGGGNTYGLDFDKNGQVIAGTNYGGKAMLHQYQGAYYVKGFSKHGPLHNAHTYGYFEHVLYKDFKGGHVTCGGIVYQADAFPPEYRDQYIAGNLLSNAIYMHTMEPVGSSYTARHGADLMTTDDMFFRPVDVFQGPDSNVYVADWTDRRAAHLDPVDNWDKTNGRIYKIEYQGTPKLAAFDLRTKTSAELIELLKHPNKWWRNEARLKLGERQDKSVVTTLKKWVAEDKGLLALESLWAIYVSGGFDGAYARELLTHPNERVREWAVRLQGDRRAVSPETYEAWESLAGTETSPTVLAQLACSAKRLDHQFAVGIAKSLVNNPACAKDAQLPLLIWWAVEDAITDQPAVGLNFGLDSQSKNPLYLKTVANVARRLMAADVKDGPEFLAQMLTKWGPDCSPVLDGMVAALEGGRLDQVPASLAAPLAKLRKDFPVDDRMLELLTRMNDRAALATLRARLADEKLSEANRLKAAKWLTQVRDASTKDLLLTALRDAKTDSLRTGFLAALSSFDDPAIGNVVLVTMHESSPAVKKSALQVLTSRPAWAKTLFDAIDTNKLPKEAVPLELARAAVGLNDTAVTKLIEKHYGKLAPATAGEKMARITWLNREITQRGTGDPVAGKLLFGKHCAACHTFFGEGGKVGPDLTTADRKNRPYMLTQIVDPSGYIRPEFVVQNVLTADGRKLSGIVAPGGTGGSLTLVNVVENKPVQTVVAQADIETILPSAISLMPEKLLDTISYQEIRDLFAYLASDPAPTAPKVQLPGTKLPVGEKKSNVARRAAPPTKKLKICLVSGSFEYKSDESLAILQELLEKNYPVECTRAFAKSETEITGLENLATSDAAIFFTRRLKIDAPELEKVKKFVESGKPIIGIRTASHGFQNWLEMDKLIFGGDYKNHLKNELKCVVAPTDAGKAHPILKGVGTIKSDGSLYRNPEVAKDLTILLTGTVGAEVYPVAWTREKDGRRVFYTSFGHPVDFKDEHFLKMLANAIAWATKSEWSK